MKLTIALLAVVAATAASSWAGTDDAEIAAVAVVNSDEFQPAAYVPCPDGQRAVGGGMVSERNANDFELVVSGPGKAGGKLLGDGDAPRGWFGAFTGPIEPTDVNVFAVCSKSDAKVAAKPVKLKPNKRGAGLARCPAGQRAVGGGVNVDELSGNVVFQQESGPVGPKGRGDRLKNGDVARGWAAKLLNGDSESRRFVVYAICSRDSRAKAAVSGAASVPPGSSTLIGHACPASKRALGGGYLPERGDPQGAYGLLGPLDETLMEGETMVGDRAAGYLAGVANVFQSERDMRFRVYALCE